MNTYIIIYLFVVLLLYIRELCDRYLTVKPFLWPIIFVKYFIKELINLITKW